MNSDTYSDIGRILPYIGGFVLRCSSKCVISLSVAVTVKYMENMEIRNSIREPHCGVASESCNKKFDGSDQQNKKNYQPNCARGHIIQLSNGLIVYTANAIIT